MGPLHARTPDRVRAAPPGRGAAARARDRLHGGTGGLARRLPGGLRELHGRQPGTPLSRDALVHSTFSPVCSHIQPSHTTHRTPSECGAQTEGHSYDSRRRWCRRFSEPRPPLLTDRWRGAGHQARTQLGSCLADADAGTAGTSAVAIVNTECNAAAGPDSPER